MLLGSPEVDPRDVGVTRDDVEAIWKATAGAYRTGLYPAIGLCIRRKGRVILDRTVGHAHGNAPFEPADANRVLARSEEHTSELQSLMRISYAVLCLKKKKSTNLK